eukprot:1926292-Amphidinium_carterae.2
MPKKQLLKGMDIPFRRQRESIIKWQDGRKDSEDGPENAFVHVQHGVRMKSIQRSGSMGLFKHVVSCLVRATCVHAPPGPSH